MYKFLFANFSQLGIIKLPHLTTADGEVRQKEGIGHRNADRMRRLCHLVILFKGMSIYHWVLDWSWLWWCWSASAKRMSEMMLMLLTAKTCPFGRGAIQQNEINSKQKEKQSDLRGIFNE